MTRDIIINGRFLSRRVTGVERYGREIIRLLGNNYRVEKMRSNGLTGHAWEQFILPSKLRSESVLWSPANTGPLAVRNQALTIHDLSPIEHPEWFRKSFASWYRLFLPILAKRVQVIFTPSEFVKQKVMKRFGVEKIVVTSNGVDLSKFQPNLRRNEYIHPKEYILFVGSLQPRKNLRVLLKVWHDIKKDFKNLWLVIAGESKNIFGKTNFATEDRIQFLGYINDDTLPELYANAKLFILPSFEEGFGLPVLEAMACGAPVIVSNGGALPETVGDAAMIFDLSKPETLSAAIQECLTNEQLCTCLREKGFARAIEFSWQASANLIWSTLNEL